MGEIDKKILIDIISKKDTAAIDATIAELENLRGKIEALKNTPIQATGVTDFQSSISAAGKSASEFGGQAQKAFRDTEQAADAAAVATRRLEEQIGSNLILTKSSTRSSADSETTTLSHRQADNPFITSQTSFDQSGGVLSTKVTQNFGAEQAAREKEAAADEAAFNKKIDQAEKARAAFLQGQRDEEAAVQASALKKQEAEGAYLANIEEKHISAIKEYIRLEAAAAEEVKQIKLRAQVALGTAQSDDVKSNQQKQLQEQIRQGQLQIADQKTHSSALAEDARRNQASNTFQDFVAQGAKVQAPEFVADNATGKLQKVQVALNETTGAMLKINEATHDLSASNKNVASAFDDASNSIQAAAGKVLIWTLATGVVFSAIRGIEGAVRTFTELEAATVSLERVGRGFGSNAAEIAEGSRNVTAALLDAKVEFGSVGAEAITASVSFARLGLSQKETIEATRAALLASNVAEISATEAANLLTSAYISFKGSVTDIPDILNKLNSLTNSTRVTTDDLLQSVSRSGAVFREAGGTFEQLAATTAVVAQATSRSGAEIGNALKFISTRLGESTVQQKLFNEAGIGIRDIEGQLKPINEVLGELVVKFQTLTEAQRTDVATAIAGSRQRNILQAALDNYYEIQNKIITQYRDSNSAQDENQKVLGTLSVKLNQLVAAFEKLGNTLVSSGIGDILKKLVDATTATVNALANLGPAALIIVGALAAYVGAVLLASSGSLGFASSLTHLKAGIASTNASIIGMITGLNFGSVALGTTTAAADATTVALTATGNSAAFAAGKIYAALAPVLPLVLAIAAAGVILYGIFKSFEAPKIDFGEGSSFEQGKSKEKAAIKTAENKAGEEKAKNDLAKTAAAELRALEELESDGTERSVQSINKRIEIGKALVKAFDLEGEARKRALAGQFNSADATALEIKSKEKLIAQIDEQIARTKRLADADRAKKEELERELETNEKIRKDAKESTAGKFLPATDEFLTESLQTTGKTKEDSKKQIDEIGKEQEGFDKKAKELEAQKKEIEQAAEQVRIYESLETIKKRSTDIHDTALSSYAPSIAGAADSAERLKRELNEVKSELNALDADANLQTAITTDPGTVGKEFHDNIEGPLLKKKAELEAKLIAEPIKIAVKLEESKLKADLNLQKDIATQLAESQSPKEARGLVKAQVEFQINQSQIQSLKGQAEAIQQELAGRDSGERFGQLDADQQRQVIQLIEQRKSKLEEAHNLSLQTASLEDRIVSEKLKGMIKITEEAKKQNDEARKALGVMSDEELVRTRILAGRVQNGTAPQIGTSEFLNLDQDSRKFLTDFNKIAPGAGILNNVNPKDLFGEAAFDGVGNRKQDRQILNDQDITNVLASLKNLRSFEGQSLDANVNNAVLNAQSIVIQNNDASRAVSAGIGGPNGTNQPPPVTVNIQGIEESATRMSDSVGNLTASINDLIRTIGTQKQSFIGVRPRENSR